MFSSIFSGPSPLVGDFLFLGGVFSYSKLCTSPTGSQSCSWLAGSHLWAIPPVRLALSGGNSGTIPERPRKRSQSVSGNSRREYGWDPPSPIIKGILRLPEHFQNYLPPSTAGAASFFRSGSGEGLSELVMEFPAVLRAFLNLSHANRPLNLRTCPLLHTNVLRFSSFKAVESSQCIPLRPKFLHN